MGLLASLAFMLVSSMALAQSPLPGGATYAINGTDAAPTSFASIGSAWAFLDTNGVTGTGDVVLELATGYVGEAGPISLGPVTGASATTGLVVRPAAGYTALTSTAGGAFPNQHAIAITGSYITLDGRAGGTGSNRDWTVHVTGTTNAQMAVRINNSTGSVTNVAVRYLNMIGEAASVTGAVFQITGNTANTMQNITVEDNFITSGALIRGYGITVASSNNAANTGLVVRNNEITNVYSRGINITATFPDGEFYGNKIHHTQTITGTAEYNGIYVSAFASNFKVYNNHIYNVNMVGGTTTAIRGIYIFSASTAALSQYYNNVIAIGDLLTGTAADRPIFGIHEWASAGSLIDIQHNTVLLTGTAAAGGNVSAAFRRQSSTLMNVNNNNFVNLRTNSGATGAHYGVIANDAFGSLGHNNYAVDATGFVGCFIVNTSNLASILAPGNRATLADWNASAAIDVASVSEAPNFVGAGATPPNLDINPTIASQLESGGMALAAITTDINGVTRSSTTPDIGAYEFAGIALDLTPPAISYAALGNQTAAAATALTGVTVSDASGINTTTAKPRAYYKKSSNANALAGNTAADNGWKWVEATNSSSPFDFSLNMTILTGGSVATGDTVEYFVTAEDLATTPNVRLSDGLTAAAAPASAVLAASAFPVSGTASAFVVSNSITGTFTVGTGGDYTSLTDSAGAFAAINGAVVSGNITLNIISNLTESGANALQPFAAPHTLTIQPSGGAFTVSASTGANSGVVNILASRVTIDGNLSGTRSLTFENASTSSPSYGIHFNSVSDVTISNVNVAAGNNNTTTTFNAIHFGGSGNTNILIEGNMVTKADFGINMDGAAAAQNTNVVVRGNMIGDAVAANTVTRRGVNLAHVVNYEVSGNTIADMSSTTNTMRAIHIEGNSTGGMIKENIIRNVDYTATSFSGGQGIVINSTNADLNVDIINNAISGLKGHGSFQRTNNSWGIIIWAGNNARIIYNAIHISDNRSTTSSATQDGGIMVNSSASTGINVINNMISVTALPSSANGKMYGIYSFGANPFGTISNNNFHVAPTAQHFVGFNGADLASITDWATAIGDSTSISADPVFTGATNLVPTSGSTSQLGTPVAGITTDITGATRNATTPDMGAYEYLPASCGLPTGLIASPAGASSINLSWTVGGSETIWEVEFDTTGFVQGTGTVSTVSGTPTTIISGLAFGGVYDFYVRAICDPVGPVASPWAGPAVGTINYCASGATSTGDSKIGSVRVGSDTIASPVGAGNCATYTDNTALPGFQLTYGVPASIEVAYGTCGSNFGSYVSIYVDFNNDLVFDQATELIAQGPVVAGTNFITANPSVPGVAQHLGATRMRVVMREFGSAANTLACGTYNYGETQDYTVTLNPAPSCVGVSSLTANPSSATSAVVTWTGDAAHQAFQLEYGAVGFTQGAGTLVSTTDTFAVISGLTAGASYDFYARGICDTVNVIAGPWVGPVGATLAYCASGATNPSDSRVGIVVINGDSVVSPVGAGNCATYTDNTALTPFQLTYGGQSDIQVHYGTCGGPYASYATVYVDFNNDLVFDPVTELVASGVSNAGAPLLASYTMPATGPVGTTRMRVVLRESGSATSNAPCGTFSWGETQDFTVILNPAPSLAAFSLLSPPSGTNFTVAGSAISTVDVSWNSSVAGATYTWLLDVPTGNFSTPLASLPANNGGADTVVSITLSAIDALLGSLNLNIGDTAQTKWTVLARSGLDSVFAVAPFDLNLIRGVINTDTVVNPFNLVSPPNNFVLDVVGASSTTASISWNAATTNNGAPVNYTWLLDAVGGTFATPLASIASNGGGADTTLMLDFGTIDGLLASLGLNIGDSVNTIWTVRGTSGTNDTLAAQSFNLRLKRGAVVYPPLNVFVPAAASGTSGLGRGPVTQNTFHRSAAVYPANEVASQLAPGQTITTLGYQITTPAAAAVSGAFKLYMVNTADVSFARSATWVDLISTPTAMQLVYDGSLTVPASVGVYNITLDTAFTYTGGGLYVAFEWVVSGSASTGASYQCNAGLGASQRNAQNNTGLPAALTGSSAFRPRISLTAPRLSNDVEVVALYTLGKLPIPSGLPHTIEAIVRNNSATPVVGRTVSLNVTGANTYAATQTVSLGVGASTTVRFENYAPTNLGFNNIVVSLAADDNNANNTASYVQETTTGTFSYADTTSTISGVGFNLGSGILAVRHDVTGSRAVESMNMRFAPATTSLGNRVYGVTMNSVGQIVSRTPNMIIDTTMLGNYVNMVFDSAHVVTDDFFFVGLVQTPGSPGYFPAMFQNESPLRPAAFYTADTLGGGLGFLGAANSFRLVMDAVTIVPAGAQDSLTNFNLVSPANNAIVNVQGVGGQTITTRWESSTATTGNPVTYEWLLDAPGGTFATPIVALTSDGSGADTSLVLSYNAIDNLLAANGVAVGGSFTGIWIVRATSGTLTKLAVAPRTITLNRGVVSDTLSAFALLTPANNATLNVAGATTQTANITWEASNFTGAGTVGYVWLLDVPTGDFTSPLASIPATTNSLTLTFGAIRNLLIANNVPVGTTLPLKWTVRASSGTNSRLANASFNLSITRGVTSLDSLTPFNLLSPTNNASRTLENDPAQSLNFNFTLSTSSFGGTVTYELLVADTTGDFTNPLMVYAGTSANTIAASFQVISDSLSLTAGTTFRGIWTIRAVNGPVSRLASSANNITFVRGVFTSTNDLSAAGALNIYPNPANNVAYLNINVEGLEDVTVRVMNAVGQEVMTKVVNVSTDGGLIELDVDNFQQGMYFVRVTDGNKVAIRRLIIQR